MVHIVTYVCNIRKSLIILYFSMHNIIIIFILYVVRDFSPFKVIIRNAVL